MNSFVTLNAILKNCSKSILVCSLSMYANTFCNIIAEENLANAPEFCQNTGIGFKALWTIPTSIQDKKAKHLIQKEYIGIWPVLFDSTLQPFLEFKQEGQIT